EPAAPPPAAPEGEVDPSMVAVPPVAEPAAPASPPAPAPAGPPPILAGRDEKPLRVMVGAVAALLLALFLGLFAPSIPESGSGVYSSAMPLSDAGKEGRDIYLAEGCAACHTQMVRAVVADAGLGGVTISDTNQVLGNRRIGPDLAHVGSRMQGAEMSSLLGFSREHPSYRYLGSADLDRVVTYLKESK
ncbi:MAG: cbb3-type cytochrome c oxidase subunit II, partial [Acidimicrobiia bacterium]|nr:cbb3-type cytochrome c oxidase subunit II [Acidimicrobiia bacterium]